MNTQLQLLKAFIKAKKVSTDTRSIAKGSIFFALKGDNFNGNEYAKTAIENGAYLVVIDEPQPDLSDEQFILVEDVLLALQDLATAYRNQLKTKIIGLTGSNGKTTCKELFRDVCTTTYKTHATKGNLNNHIGVPLTLLSIPEDTDIAIIEMGANHQGEIEMLCKMCQPDIGYITNFGKAHLEGFGGVEGVIKGKSELYNYLRANNKTALVNADDPLQVAKSNGIKCVFFGENPQADIQLTNMHTEQASAQFIDATIHSQLTGSFHFVNIAASIALGKMLNVDLQNIKAAIENYNPQMNRSEWRKTERNKILMDAYNANPDSMLATIETFAKLQKPNKWFVLGDMFELGNYAAEEHQAIVTKLTELKAKNVVLVGEAFMRTEFPAAYKGFKTTEEARNFLQRNKLSSSTILLKGSRGMKLETLVEFL